MKWTITKLIAIGALAVIALLVGLLGNVLVGITGIPGIGSLIMCFFAPVIFAFLCLLIKKFGAATLMGLLYGILALPLPSWGPPGFLPKIFAIGIMGLAIDFVFFLFRKNEKLAAIIIGIPTNVVGILAMVGTFLLFKIPSVEKSIKILLSPLLAVMIILGLLGGWVGYIIFKRLQNTMVIKRIQGIQKNE